MRTQDVGRAMCLSTMGTAPFAAPPAPFVVSWYYMAITLVLLFGGRKLMSRGY